MAGLPIRILNNTDVISHAVAVPSAVELSRELQKLMLRMKGCYMKADGRGVHYTALKSSEVFAEYLLKSNELNNVDVTTGMSIEERTAFFLNIYNALTIHGLTVAADGDSSPNSVLEINNFWQTTAYNVGGFVLTLDDIEHGILRGNKHHPSSTKPQFTEDDPRLKLSLPHVDPRFHFALVCGAKSCPPINIYSAKNLETGLNAATRAFLAQEVSIHDNKIMLSKIFNWYKDDFAADDIGLLRWMSHYLPEERKDKIEELINECGDNIQIKWKDYNWSLNKL